LLFVFDKSAWIGRARTKELIMAIKWRKVFVSEQRYEAAGVADVNGDGIPDIVSGAYWYEGPDFKRRHFVGDIMPIGEHYDDFSTIFMDINGNGRPDYVTGGAWGGSVRWRENPSDPEKPWPEHIVAECDPLERACAWDVDGDDMLEIVPNMPCGPLTIYKLKTDEHGKGMGEFVAHTIREEHQGHGLGAGDIAGNGRCDFVLNKGWLEAPEDPYNGQWLWHPEFELGGEASTPMLVVDVNRDGLCDIIVGHGHGYGLYWWEQTRQNGKRGWLRHPIDPYISQYHDMRWVDIDGDGENELVTGKRYRAHDGLDPGSGDDMGIYYFKWNGESFTKQIIDYGPVGQASSCGIYFDVADLTGNGLLDVIAPGKDGLYVFFNEGNCR